MNDVLMLFPVDERGNLPALLAIDDLALPPGWPATGIAPHPYAAINRMMTGDEARELRTDIAANGLLRKIVMFEDKILDGRNRYLECVALGRFASNVDWRTHPDFIEFGGPRWDKDEGTDPLAYVWSMETRRHSSARDVALAAARYLKFVAALKPEFPDAKSTRLKLPSQAELAKRRGISERLINSAMVLLDRAEPEVIAAVEQGTLALTDAADVVSKQTPEVQREIAAAPDKKAAKAKVKAAKAKPLPKAPELPSPMSRTELAAFAETVILEAHRVRDKHNGTGASMSADLVLGAAKKHGIIETVDVFGFSRSMLLALGKLREEAKPAGGKKAAEPDRGPRELPLGGQWSQAVLGFKGKGHHGKIEVFHEADDTYSVRYGYTLSGSGGASPFSGSYITFREAIGEAAARLIRGLDPAHDLGRSASDHASAGAATKWLRDKLAGWDIVIPSSVTEREGEGQEGSKQPAPGLPDPPSDHATLTSAQKNDIIREGYAANTPLDELAARTGLSKDAVKQRARTMKLGDPERQRAAASAAMTKVNEKRWGAAGA